MADERWREQRTPDAISTLISRSLPVRIVLLEDSDDDVEIIRKELARSDINFQLRAVSSRSDFEAALGSQPDIVLSDYWLPELSGEQALAICKARCPEARFILLSGHLKEDFVIRALKQGADDFVVKSRLSRLGPAVHKALSEMAEKKRLNEVENKLAGTEEQFRTLFSAAPIGLAVLSSQGEIRQINSALGRMLRFENAEWSGKSIYEFMAPQAQDKLKSLVQDLIDSTSLDFHCEEQFITQDDRKVWAQISVSKVPAGREGNYLILTLTDVTREKQKARFEALLAKLDRALSAAHDLEKAKRSILETITEAIPCNGAWVFFAMCEGTPENILGQEGRPPNCWQSTIPLESETWKNIKVALANPGTEQSAVLGRLLPQHNTGSLLWVPLLVNNEIRGFLAARSDASEDQPQRLHDLTRIANECSEALLRIQVTEELKESENRYRTVCEAVPIGIFEADLEGKWTYTNVRLRQVLLRESEGCLGKAWFTHIFPEDAAEVVNSWDHSVEAGTPWRTECRLVTRQGDIRWVRVFATPRSHLDEPLGRFIGTVEDVTERRRAESASLALANIVNNASDAIIGLSPQGIIVSWNRGAERTYGYSAEEAINQPISILIPPERKSEHPLTLLNDENEIQDFETVRVRKDGKRINVSLTVSAVRDARGMLVGASAITRDITERKRIEQEVLDAVTNEQRRIGHDLHDGLGQFLTGLAFRAKMLADSLQEKKLEEFSDAAQLVDLLNSATSQTRALARGLDPIAVEAQEIAFALTQLAEQAELLMRVKCKTVLPQKRVNIFAFASLHLYRIAQESITNAVKHGNAKQIEIKLESSDEGVVLEVKDNGKGFNTEQIRASGIGLRILQYRARSIGGVLTINSIPGKGTSVRCFVPANQLLQEPKEFSIPHGVTTC